MLDFRGKALLRGLLGYWPPSLSTNHAPIPMMLPATLENKKKSLVRIVSGCSKKIVHGWGGSWILNLPYGFLNSLSFPNNISQENPLRIWRVFPEPSPMPFRASWDPLKSAKKSSPQTEPATNTRPPCIQTPRRTTKRAPWVPNIYFFVPGKFLSEKRENQNMKDTKDCS